MPYRYVLRIVVIQPVLQVIPVSTLFLGVWQVRRRIWKTGIIEDLEKRLQCEPITLPQELDNNLINWVIFLMRHFLNS